MTIATSRSNVVSVSATKRISLRAVLRYENEAVVRRIMQELKLNHDDAYALFKDTLRYLWLAAIVPVQGVVPAPKIDEGWHTFLLFTVDYQEFCLRYFGKFIHHRPRRPEDKPDGGALRRKTFTDIAKYLGDNLSENWKYKKQNLNKDCEQSCAPSRDCNGGSNCS